MAPALCAELTETAAANVRQPRSMVDLAGQHFAGVSVALIDQLPTFDAKKLEAIEQNAERWISSGTDKQKIEAEVVLLAIRNDRQRRRDGADQKRQKLLANVAEKVRDMPFLERVVLAFTEMPPEAWEVEVLKEIAANPDRDFDTLARAVGKRGGGYINLAVGTLCSTREAYLGPAPAAEKNPGQKVYSGLLIDFTRHEGPKKGTEWHGWTLKPEAEAALRQLRIVG